MLVALSFHFPPSQDDAGLALLPNMFWKSSGHGAVFSRLRFCQLTHERHLQPPVMEHVWEHAGWRILVALRILCGCYC